MLHTHTHSDCKWSFPSDWPFGEDNQVTSRWAAQTQTHREGETREREKKVAQAYIEHKWRGALAITFTLDSLSLHSIVYKEEKRGAT